MAVFRVIFEVSFFWQRGTGERAGLACLLLSQPYGHVSMGEPEPEGKVSREGGSFAPQLAVCKDSGGGDKSPAERPCTDWQRNNIAGQRLQRRAGWGAGPAAPKTFPAWVLFMVDLYPAKCVALVGGEDIILTYIEGQLEAAA